MTGFRWNDWNLREATKHGCRVAEIEEVVLKGMRRRVVEDSGDDSYRVVGRERGGRTIFLFDAPDASVMYEETVYVIHAMPLTTRRRRG